MTGAGEWPPYLPGRAYDLMTVNDQWSAVSVHLEWAHLVVGALGDACGPVYSDAGLGRGTWFLPPGGGADWPDAEEAGVFSWYPPGAELLVPGPDGCASMNWLRYPLVGPAFTDPGTLRLAVETVVGPLETAGQLGPLVVCYVCGSAARDFECVASGEQLSGPGWSVYACRPCYDTGGGRHLRLVKEPPQ